MTSSMAMAQVDLSSIVSEVEDFIRLPPSAGRIAWPMFEPTWKNDPAHVDAALRALATEGRRFEKDDSRARVIRLLVESTRDISHWPTNWRQHHGAGLHQSLDALLGMYQTKHAQMERIVDLFDHLDLWTSDQSAWLTDTYLNKIWPRLVVPWLRSLEYAPAHVRAEILRSVENANRPMPINFLTRAVAYHISPPQTVGGVFRLLIAFAIDAAEQKVTGASRQGYRVMSNTEMFNAKAGERYRREVNKVLNDTFTLLRKRYQDGGADNEVVDAVQRARRVKMGVTGRKTPEQDVLLTRLLNYIEDTDPRPLRKLLDVGEAPRFCGEPLVR